MAPIILLVQYHSLLNMFHKYYFDEGIALRPPILFGRQHSSIRSILLLWVAVREALLIDRVAMWLSEGKTLKGIVT